MPCFAALQYQRIAFKLSGQGGNSPTRPGELLTPAPTRPQLTPQHCLDVWKTLHTCCSLTLVGRPLRPAHLHLHVPPLRPTQPQQQVQPRIASMQHSLVRRQRLLLLLPHRLLRSQRRPQRQIA